MKVLPIPKIRPLIIVLDIPNERNESKEITNEKDFIVLREYETNSLYVEVAVSL